MLFFQLPRVQLMHVWNLCSSVTPTRLRNTVLNGFIVPHNTISYISMSHSPTHPARPGHTAASAWTSVPGMSRCPSGGRTSLQRRGTRPRCTLGANGFLVKFKYILLLHDICLYYSPSQGRIKEIQPLLPFIKIRAPLLIPALSARKPWGGGIMRD